jgi:hypothetical protein
LVPKPGREFWAGEYPSWATVIPWQSSYGQWCTFMGFLVWCLYGCTRAKRCPSSQEECSQCPPPSSNSLTSLQISFSPSFLPHYLLHDSITLTLPAKPPHHTDSSFGKRVRGNFPFWLDSSPQIIVSQLFLPNSHTSLGPDLLVMHKNLTSRSSATSCRALCQFHSGHSQLQCSYLSPYFSPYSCLAPSE